MQRALPNPQLGVVPGDLARAAHGKAEVMNRLVLDLLADEQVPKMLPLSDMLAETAH